LVAYSFKYRFAEPIIAGTKRQTIRADRKRHARPGERLQLFTGMRTRQCRKILDVDPVCIEVVPVRLIFAQDWRSCIFKIDTILLLPASMQIFARDDGFEDVEDMQKFWVAEHGIGPRPAIDFCGVLIRWALAMETKQ
jgi:hypothetical protein